MHFKNNGTSVELLFFTPAEDLPIQGNGTTKEVNYKMTGLLLACSRVC